MNCNLFLILIFFTTHLVSCSSLKEKTKFSNIEEPMPILTEVKDENESSAIIQSCFNKVEDELHNYSNMPPKNATTEDKIVSGLIGGVTGAVVGTVFNKPIEGTVEGSEAGIKVAEYSARKKRKKWEELRRKRTFQLTYRRWKFYVEQCLKQKGYRISHWE